MFKINNKIISIIIISCITFSYAARASMEFTSAKTYARIEKNLPKAEEFGLLALTKEPDNSYIPYFLAKEVFMMQKKNKEAGDMFIEALKRPDSKLEKPFKIGKTRYKTVHQAVTLYADEFYNNAIDYYNKEKFDEAVSMTNICLKLDPNHVRSYMLLSEINGNVNNDINEAIYYLDKALQQNLSNQESFDIYLQKASYFRKSKRFDEASKILIDLGEIYKKNILLKRSLFFLYIDMNNIETAIPYGENLFLLMENDTDISMSLIAECAFNLAILFRNLGAIKYNEIIKYFSDSEITNDKTNQNISKCNDVIALYESAKNYFQNSLNYDEEGSDITKQYKKEMRKEIKKMKNDIIPQLEILLK